MKDLLARIKSYDYKQFALKHGEKIGLGVVGVIVVTCLALTNWASGYSGTPYDMVEKADKVAATLRANKWPEDEKKQFLPVVTADAEVKNVLAPLDIARFDWQEPFSRKIYERRLPADEAEWLAALDLRAIPGSAPIEVLPPLEAPAAEDDDSGTSKKKSDKDKKKPAGGELEIRASGAGGVGGQSAGRSRGVRFIAVVGIVPVRKQQERLRSALHLDSVSQAAGRLEYLDFRLQRQRAVPGPNPWSDENWKDVSTSSLTDLLNEAADFDPEVVAPEYTDVVFTSPLPHRLDDGWNPGLIVHPKIPTLTEEQQQAELALNKAAAEAAGDEEEPKGARRGLSRVQRDARQLRKRALSAEGGEKKLSEAYQKMNPGMNMNKMPGPNRGNEAMPMLGGGAGDLGFDSMLFRYLDFDVEPGECYRYRVQLVVANPSFEQAFVSAQSVAVGETRESPWSGPSTPAVVEKDVEYALVKVPERQGRRSGADLKVVQVDPDVGTLISATFNVAYGAFVGTKIKSLHLDPVAETLDEDDVTFTSKDVLLDSAAIPQLAGSVISDLSLPQKKVSEMKKNGSLDLAATLNRFGEIVTLDADSNADLKPALDRVKEQRQPYEEEAKEKKNKSAGSGLDDLVKKKSGGSEKKDRKNKKDKVGNALKLPGMPGGAADALGTGIPGGAKKGKKGGSAGGAGGISR